MFKIAFCGHSDFSETEEIKQRLLALLEEHATDSTEFLCGGYGRFDSFAVRCCVQWRKAHSGARLVLVVPYRDEGYLKRVFRETDVFDEVEYPLERKVPHRFAIVERNKKLVDGADLVIAYVDHRWGGAYKTMCYAVKKGKKVINLCPDV